MINESIEVWGYNSYRPFRIYWILEEFNLPYKSYKIGSRTGETQTIEYLLMNPKGKIPILKHKSIIITESIAAVNYIVDNFDSPLGFYTPTSSRDIAKIDEWSYFCAMELDCLSIYTLRKHELPERSGLSIIYGESDNAVKSARKHFDRMIKACEKDVPSSEWLFGDRICSADIIFISCLISAKRFKLEIKSDKINAYLERAKNRKNFLESFVKTFGSHNDY